MTDSASPDGAALLGETPSGDPHRCRQKHTLGNVAFKNEGAHDQAPSSMSVHSQIKSCRLDSVLEKLNDMTGSRQPPAFASAPARRHPARRPTLSRLLERLRRPAGSSISGERDAERRRAPNEVITKHPRPDR